MTEIDSISLENEMDVVIAQQHMIKAAKILRLTLSTQTTIATAVAEISRVVIDKTDTGRLTIGLENKEGKYFFTGTIAYSELAGITATDDNLRYARLLVPEFRFEKRKNKQHSITVQIGIPRMTKITKDLINTCIETFKDATPSTPYEKLKMRNSLLEEQTQEKELQLQQTRLLNEKKDDFISIASHELKTPLTTLIAFAQLGLSEIKKNTSADARPYLEKINTQAYKLHSMIQQLLDISKIDAGKMEVNKKRVQWRAYINELKPMFEMMVSQHHLGISECDEAIYVVIDKLRIEQVLANMINNAAKYSRQGTAIQLSCSIQNSLLVVSISDQGPGVAEQHLTQVFDKYFREPEKASGFSGFGMGLYISANIVQAHGGDIRAKNNTAQGSSFYFSLPLAASYK